MGKIRKAIGLLVRVDFFPLLHISCGSCGHQFDGNELKIYYHLHINKFIPHLTEWTQQTKGKDYRQQSHFWYTAFRALKPVQYEIPADI